MRRARSKVGATVLAIAALAGCSSSSGTGTGARTASGAAPGGAASACTAAVTGGAPLEPAAGAWFGVNLDWENDSPASYAGRLGRTPAVFVEFAAFPLDDAPGERLDAVIDQVADVGGMALLTLEPRGGLEAVTPAVAAALGERLAGYNRRGVPVFVRFAHEMNGSWYPWSQQPAEFVRAFRTVADAVHRLAPASATVWAPNYGGGYPFAGGAHAAEPGTAAFATLDTDGDGSLSMTDDPYGPYYPGDDAVDWVGMSLYHWGSAYPWGENELPEPGKFVAQLTGEYDGAGGDDTALPDFSAVWSVGRDKPLAVTETAAFHAPGRGGADAAETKRRWWGQVLDPAARERVPRLAMVNWFEWDKQEQEVGGRVDWTVTRHPRLAGEFGAALGQGFSFSSEVAAACRR
ncbi:MAG TPA: hypothetical protein VM242_07350 [Acidimicrobiales bacterium]|jgi:hypothetical protein|nr:hypothetical protein [Acidimicrobiales bacterium]